MNIFQIEKQRKQENNLGGMKDFDFIRDYNK